ncbi:MAG: rhomboid family intramembrane serine protease [Candidatus Melainabacteria bacterium]|nr:MAG: rhomboid family intramembrane serine protease [Candidatus Melainabacteria bacterium]
MSVFIPNILPLCARKEAALVYQLYSLVRDRIRGERKTEIESKRLWSRLFKSVCDAPVTSALLVAILVAHVVKVSFFSDAPWTSLAVYVPDAKDQILSANALLMLTAWAHMLKASFFHHHWLHLFSNATALFATGMALERRIGSAIFAGLYVASALVGYTLLVLLSAEGYAWGASEATWGVLAAFALIFSRCSVWSTVLLPPFIPIPFKATVRLALGVFFVLKLADAYLNLQGQTIQYAHFSGAAVGVCFALVWLSIKSRKC